MNNTVIAVDRAKDIYEIAIPAVSRKIQE